LFCPSCGQTVPEDSQFCASCGARLGVVQAPAAVTGQTASSSSPFAGTEFIIEQKIVAMRDTFAIKDRSGNLFAYVKRKMVSLGPNFWFESPNGTRLGEVKGKVVAVRPTFEVYGAKDSCLPSSRRR
jgi:hypothetical protein